MDKRKEINTPLVDILSKLSGKQVVMNDDKYVYLNNSENVSKSLISNAIKIRGERENEQLKRDVREKRNKELADILKRIERYQRQLLLGKGTTESADSFNLLLQCAQDLSDVPQQDGFPATIEWPEIPEEVV